MGRKRHLSRYRLRRRSADHALCKDISEASFVGMDYWGKEWSYAKEQCEQNAKLEGCGSPGPF